MLYRVTIKRVLGSKIFGINPKVKSKIFDVNPKVKSKIFDVNPKVKPKIFGINPKIVHDMGYTSLIKPKF